MKEYRQKISKETFDGNWPFKVDTGIVINKGSAVFFACDINHFGRLITKIYAINGNAIDLRKYYGAKRLPLKLRNSPNRMSVNDVIKYGLSLNPEWQKHIKNLSHNESLTSKNV